MNRLLQFIYGRLSLPLSKNGAANCGGGGLSHQKSSNVKRRRAEDKMAMIFVAIVIGFLISNFPRIFLNFHEVITHDTAVECMKAGKRCAEE